MNDAATAPEPDPDGTDLPTTPAVLLARLAALGIACDTVRHAAVHTVEQSEAVRLATPALQSGLHVKNLFLRNRREEAWLVTVEKQRPIDLRQLGERLGAGKLSFGSPERLMRVLGVRPGSVTPLALVNDTTHAVRFAIDAELVDAPVLWAHPLVNTMTTKLSGEGLRRFLDATGHVATVLRFPSA